MRKTIGKCGHCGGRVTVPAHFMSVKPPIPECEKCGAQVDDTAHLPVMTMKPRELRVEHVQREPYTTMPDPVEFGYGRTLVR